MDIPQVSFSRGEISPIAADRTDQAFYGNAVDACVNFFVRREGAVSNRPGLEFIGACLSNTPNGSYLLPFIYNNAQAYLTEFTAGFTAVYENGDQVQSGIVNPYALGDLANLRWAQSADVMNVVVATQPMAQLKRLTPTTFSFTTPQLLFGPFQDTNTDGTTTVYASAQQGSVALTASKAIFLPTHVGSLFYLEEQFLSWIQPWEANKILSTTASDVIGSFIRSDGKIYRCVATGGSGTVATGTFQPVHTSGTLWDGNGQQVPGSTDNYGVAWQFVSTDAGVALITAYTDSTHVTAVVQSYKGVWSNFPPTCVGGPVAIHGPYTSSGDGATATFTNLSSITSNDPNNYYVTIGGIFQDPTTYVITVSATSITFFTPPVTGTNNIVVSQVAPVPTTGTPLTSTGLNFSTYWAFGSISPIQGYPSAICYYDDRLMLAATQLQPQTFFGSQVSNYLDYGVSSPQVDSDAITETLNSRQQNPIVDMIPLNQLLLGTATSTQLVTNSAADGSITPSDISVVPQEFYGLADVPVAMTGSTAIYVQWGGRKIRDVVYQYLYSKFLGQELTVFAQQMFPFGTTCTRLAFAPEPFQLAYCVRSDGVMCVLTYLPEQQLIAWTRFITAGNFEDVCVLPENNTYSVYVIVGRTIQGQYVRYIERFAAREWTNTNDMFFVDSGLTYDGRNTSATTMVLTGGTSWLAGDTGNLNASSNAGWANFQASDVTNDNVIYLFDPSGKRTRVQITAVNSITNATVSFLDIIPASLQNLATSVWTFARTVFVGLTNLVGQTIAVQADGGVLPQQVVSLTGTFTLPNAYGVVHAGLPYNCQIQGLNYNIQGQESIRNRMKTTTRASVVVDQSAPFDVGPSFANMTKVPMREFENYGYPTNLLTGVVQVLPPSEPSDDARLCIQQSDPAPLTILGWQADVDIGEAL